MYPTEIRAARLAAGLTQAEAAKLVKAASYRTWQDWESGKRKMSDARWALWEILTKK